MSVVRVGVPGGGLDPGETAAATAALVAASVDVPVGTTSAIDDAIAAQAILTSVEIADAGASAAALAEVQTESITATVDGLTFGVISDVTDFAIVVCDDANKIVQLPTPTEGAEIRIMNGATGYELRSTVPATVAINGGTGVNAESAIAAATYVHCRCATAVAWLCSQISTAGVITPVDVAAP